MDVFNTIPEGIHWPVIIGMGPIALMLLLAAIGLVVSALGEATPGDLVDEKDSGNFWRKFLAVTGVGAITSVGISLVMLPGFMLRLFNVPLGISWIIGIPIGLGALIGAAGLLIRWQDWRHKSKPPVA